MSCDLFREFARVLPWLEMPVRIVSSCFWFWPQSAPIYQVQDFLDGIGERGIRHLVGFHGVCLAAKNLDTCQAALFCCIFFEVGWDVGRLLCLPGVVLGVLLFQSWQRFCLWQSVVFSGFLPLPPVWSTESRWFLVGGPLYDLLVWGVPWICGCILGLELNLSIVLCGEGLWGEWWLVFFFLYVWLPYFSLFLLIQAISRIRRSTVPIHIFWHFVVKEGKNHFLALIFTSVSYYCSMYK